MNNSTGVILFILTLAVSTLHPLVANATSEQCDTIRLDQENGSMKDIPIVDQGDVSNCYAYVAAQVMDAWKQQQKKSGIKFGLDSGQTSATFSALEYTVRKKLNDIDPCERLEFSLNRENGKAVDAMILNPPLPFEFGNACEVFNLIKEKGGCPDSSVEDYIRPLREKFYKAEWQERLAESPSLRAKEVSGESSSLKEYIFSKLTTSRASSDLAFLKSANNPEHWVRHCTKREIDAANCADPAQNQSKSFIDPKLIETSQKLARDSIKDFLHEIETNACPKRAGVLLSKTAGCGPACNFDRLTQEKKKQMAVAVEKELSMPNALPPSFEICQQAIKRDASPGQSCTESDLHDILLVGQERNQKTGKCQYILRSSWGRECSDLICHSAECFCDPQSGQIFVDRDIVIKNSASVTFYQAASKCGK